MITNATHEKIIKKPKQASVSPTIKHKWKRVTNKREWNQND